MYGTIKTKEVTKSAKNSNIFVTSASDLGWAPGQFYNPIKTDLGDGSKLEFEEFDAGKFVYAQYSSDTKVIVYAD